MNTTATIQTTREHEQIEQELAVFLLASQRGNRKARQQFDHIIRRLGYFAFGTKFFYQFFKATQSGLTNKDTVKVSNLIRKSEVLKVVLDSGEPYHKLYINKDKPCFECFRATKQPQKAQQQKQRKTTYATFNLEVGNIIARTCSCGNFFSLNRRALDRCTCIKLPNWFFREPSFNVNLPSFF